MKVIGIAAITIDGYISKGKSDKLLWSKDKLFFKKQTMGHTIIMGSQTRKNISSTLKGRKIITIHREDDPQKILNSIGIYSLCQHEKPTLEFFLLADIVLFLDLKNGARK